MSDLLRYSSSAHITFNPEQSNLEFMRQFPEFVALEEKAVSLERANQSMAATLAAICEGESITSELAIALRQLQKVEALLLQQNATYAALREEHLALLARTFPNTLPLEDSVVEEIG